MTLLTRNGLQRRNFPALLDNFFNNDLFDRFSHNFSATSTTLPAVNIRETNDAFEVEMAAPGMSKDDFIIELDNQQLRIKSEKEDNWQEKENEGYVMREYSYQSFERSFNLSKQVVDADKIEANYDNGVLRLVIPKKEEAKQHPPRRIEVH